jgi:drug/metabolite transporter (DMT)-like permease
MAFMTDLLTVEREPATTTAVLPGFAGVLAMVCVGGSVAVSSVLAGGPMLTAQSLRYAAACAVLVGMGRLTGQRVPRPRGREWLWLAGVTALGLMLFNVALVRGSAHAEPAVLGVAVACVPLLFAVIGPIQQGHRPRPVVMAAAVLVTAGAALVEGIGRTDGVGIGWAVVVFACEAGFTLLAVPVLGRLRPWGVSVHTTWLSAIGFAVLALWRDGPTAAARLDCEDVLAIVYLAVGVTAVAFVFWYTCVTRLGAGRAGLLTGVAPVAAAATGILLGAPVPRLPVWFGIGVVMLGLVLGLRPGPDQPR